MIRAIRSSVTPNQADNDESSSMLPPLQLAIQELPADEKDDSPTFTITGTWQVKNAQSVRGLLL